MKCSGPPKKRVILRAAQKGSPSSPLMIPKPSVLGSAQGRMPEKKYEITSQQNPLACITDIFDLNSNLKHS